MELHPRDARGHTPRFTGRLRRAVILAALFQTRKASAGEGFTLRGRVVATRQVSAHPMRLRFVGTHMAASSMHKVAARLVGTVKSVDGEVDFELVDTDGYRATGALSPEQSCVWVEEGWTRAVVPKRLSTPERDARAALDKSAPISSFHYPMRTKECPTNDSQSPFWW